MSRQQGNKKNIFDKAKDSKSGTDRKRKRTESEEQYEDEENINNTNIPKRLRTDSVSQPNPNAISNLNQNLQESEQPPQSEIEEKSAVDDEREKIAEDDAFDPNELTHEERLMFLKGYPLDLLKKAYTFFVSPVGVSNFGKKDIMDELARSALFEDIHNLLMTGDMATYIPVWKELESAVQEPVFADEKTWKQFYQRTGIAGYDNGKVFLSNWGIRTMESKGISTLWEMEELDDFVQKWEDIMEPVLKTNTGSIYLQLLEFYISLPQKDFLPVDFPRKASMIYDILQLHKRIEPHWSELDLEVKLYGIWHVFFADFKQQANKIMPCKIKGSLYEKIELFPDMHMTNKEKVPCIIIENGAEKAKFPKHKDTPKILATGRLSNTFTLSTFDTKKASCFLVLNGGEYMSVLLMKAALFTRNDTQMRSYNVTHFAEEIVDQNQQVKKSDITASYNIKNYSSIIKMFVAIHIECKEMKFTKRQNPITFTRVPITAAASQPNIYLHTPDGKFPISRTKPNEPKGTDQGKIDEVTETVDVPFPLRQELLLKNARAHVDLVERKIRRLDIGSYTQFCGKVLALEQDGQLPFEFRLMSKLDHPNIMKIQEIVVNKAKTHCMAVMDWINDDIGTRLCGFEKTAIAKGVLSALDYLHDANIVHADVKLSNVVAENCDDEQAKTQLMHTYLIDFGESFYTNEPPNEIVGTDPYLAPEVLNSKFCSKAMDMWGYGLLLFELYFGSGLTVTGELKQAAIDWFNRQEYNFALVESLFDLIWSCLEEDPSKRITAKQALQHPFWTEITQYRHNHPIIYYILGNVLNLDGPVDWEAVIKEDKCHRKKVEDITSCAKKTVPVEHKPQTSHRKILGDITNLM